MEEDKARGRLIHNALLAVDLINGGNEPENLAWLAALADSLGCPPAPPVAGPQSPRAQAAAAQRRLNGEIDRLWLPALADYLRQVLTGRAPPGGPDAVRIATALRQLAHDSGVIEPRPTARGALAAAASHIGQQAAQSATVICDALDSPDAPDIATLSLEMMRLEAARYIAESLGEARLASEFAYISRRIARIALNRAAATIDSFLAERDLMRLFDNAAILGRIDDMIGLALRVLDAKATHEEEITAFVEPADQTALAGFIISVAKLSETLMDLLQRVLIGGRGGAVFRHGLLRQIGCIGRFCTHVVHVERPPALDAIDAGLRQRLFGLALRLGRADGTTGPDDLPLDAWLSRLDHA